MKQKKLLALIGSICLVLVLTATSLMTACAGPGPAPTPSPGPAPTPSPEPAPYYAGKLITIVVGSQAGGGTDAVARITAALLPRYLPGEPKVVVRNTPGGGGTIAMNAFYNTTKPDGLTLMVTGSGLMTMQMEQTEIVKYDLMKCVAIGNATGGATIMVIREEALSRLTDPNAEPVICGSKAGVEQWMVMPMYGREFLGWNIRWILGYSGVADFGMAIRRAEIDMSGEVGTRTIRDLAIEGAAEPLVQFGLRQPGGGFMPRPDFPDVPLFTDVLGEKRPEGLPWEAYMGWILPQQTDKLLLAPPGTPPEITDVLRDAYAKMVRDPEFDKIMRQRVNESYGVGIGEETATLIREALTMTPEALDYIKELQHKFGIK